ncbi:MAG: biotin/lipoyl-binding protein [Clostridiales bacterium]|nr:biotin/lipoyl-binding protein [Clostridiales bacterium]
MRSKLLALASFLLALVMLSGCGLLPTEETPRTAPVVSSYEQETYTTVAVQRGDMILSDTVNCSYVPLQSVNLNFDIGGEKIDEIFVEVGATVTKGQLLAQLNLDDLEEQIVSAKIDIERLNLQIAHLESELALELRRCEINGADMSAADLQLLIDETNARFASQRIALDDSLYLQTLKLDTLQTELEGRQIRAPFDGIVTYVREYEAGATSVRTERAVTIADASLSLFRAETIRWQYFHPGDEYDIIVGDAIYPAVVASEEDLGIQPQEKVEGRLGYIYFVLKEPAFGLDSDTRGSLTLLMDERRDVLHLPVDAVVTSEGKSIIYYVREDGLKAYKDVTVGLVANRRIEIVSGLEEGEHVIVD